MATGYNWVLSCYGHGNSLQLINVSISKPLEVEKQRDGCDGAMARCETPQVNFVSVQPAAANFDATDSGK